MQSINLVASSHAIMALRLVDAGVLLPGETGYFVPPPLVFSPIATPAESPDVHAMLFIPDSVANKAEILARIPAEMINQPGSPLRVVVGGVPAEVVDALPDWAYRKALDRLALTAAWDAAVAAAGKDASIWWDRATKISTLEDEWKAIVAEMEWGEHTERELINRAHNIADPTPKAEEPVEPVVTP